MLGGVWNYHLFILMDCELFVLIGWGGLRVIMLLLGSIETEQIRLLLSEWGQRFIHCWPWLYLSAEARLSMYWKFSCLLILQSPWRAACEDSDSLLKRPLKFAVNVCALCRSCCLCAPALSLFTRCWSNVASCQALSASGCSVSVSSLCLFLNPLMVLSRRGILPHH